MFTEEQLKLIADAVEDYGMIEVDKDMPVEELSYEARELLS